MITGYVGLIGQGKTMLAVREAVALARRRNAILASNILVTCPGVEFVRLSVGNDGLEGIPELLTRSHGEGRGVVVLADELGIITPARFWQSGMSIDLMWAVSQSRKLAADLIFTSQNVEQVDSFLRKLTSHVYKVRAYPKPSIERREKGKRPWFYIVSQWEPGDVDKKDKRIGRSFTRYNRLWESWYSTDELVHPPSFLRGTTPKGRRRGTTVEAPVSVVGEPGTQAASLGAPEGALVA